MKLFLREYCLEVGQTEQLDCSFVRRKIMCLPTIAEIENELSDK